MNYSANHFGSSTLGRMHEANSIREAKEFLIGLIVQEAELEGAPLSETERKMLYFSETASTLPDIDQVNKDFERDHDQDEYEQKIGGLVWNLKTRLKKENPEELRNWDAAVRQLRKEDHYLLVLIDAGSSRPHTASRNSPPLWSYVLGIGTAGLIVLYILAH